MNNERVEGPPQQIHGKPKPRWDRLPDDDLDVAYGGTAHLDGGLDELYYGITSGESNPHLEGFGLDPLQDHDSGI